MPQGQYRLADFEPAPVRPPPAQAQGRYRLEDFRPAPPVTTPRQAAPPRLTTPLPAAATRGMLPPSTVAGDPEPFNPPRFIMAGPQRPPRLTRGVTRRQAAARTADIGLPVAPTTSAPPPATFLGRVNDLLISVVKGAIGVPEAAVGLADIPTGGRAGKAAEAVGFKPAEAKEILDTYYTEQQQRANRTVSEADGFVETAVAALKNPSVILQSVVESAPTMLSGAGAARALIRAGMPVIAAAAVGEGTVSAGLTAEQIRQRSATGTLTPTQAALATGSGVVTSGFGALGARLAKAAGVLDVETLIAAGVKNQQARAGLVKAIIAGAVLEGLVEEFPQSIQEQIAQNVATGRPWEEGVSNAGVLGTFAGGIMGGGAQVGTIAIRPRRAPQTPPEAAPAPAGPTPFPQPITTPALAVAAPAGSQGQFRVAEPPVGAAVTDLVERPPVRTAHPAAPQPPAPVVAAPAPPRELAPAALSEPAGDRPVLEPYQQAIEADRTRAARLGVAPNPTAAVMAVLAGRGLDPATQRERADDILTLLRMTEEDRVIAARTRPTATFPLTGEARIDTGAPSAQTTPDVTPESEAGPEPRPEGRAPLDRIAASVPTRLESREQEGKRRTSHYRDVFRRILADAQAHDPLIDPRELRTEFDARIGFIEELDEEFRASGHNPRVLLEAIAQRGGISMEAEGLGGLTGELRWLRENAAGLYGNFAGVPNVFRQRTTAAEEARGILRMGLSLDDMATSLQQDPEFAHITGPNELLAALEDVSRMGDVGARGATYPGTVELATRAGMRSGEAWWRDSWREEARGSEPEPLTAESYQRAFGGTPAQADAVIAVVDAMGIPRDRVRVAKGGPTGELTQASRQQVESPAFKAWFGKGTPRANATLNGDPMVLYHGTTKDFTDFKPGTGGSAGPGIYLSKGAELSGYFADRTGGRVLPVYARGRYLRVPYDEVVNIHTWNDRARREGYDGLDTGLGELVVFNPENIKSAIGNRGTFDPTSAHILYQDAAEPAPIFYSKLRQVLDQKMPNRGATPGQVLAILTNPQSGVKADEISWSGLRGWLTERVSQTQGVRDTVTTQEVLAFLDANQIQVKEVVRGEPRPAEIQQEIERIEDLRDRGGRMSHDEAQRRINELKAQASQPTKFGTYTLPGGENYRELLLTLPPTPSNVRALRGRGPAANFTGGHYSEPNVLAHIRFNDRTDAQGRKVLFVEEVQSDWSAKLRRELLQPESARKLAEKRLGGEMATVMPLQARDGGMLAVLQHDQIRREVIRRIPVDVVNVLRSLQTTPEQVLSDPSVLSQPVPDEARRRIGLAVLDAMRGVGADLRAKLLDASAAGGDKQLLPALKASDLNAREVVGLASPERLYHVRLPSTPSVPRIALAGAEGLGGASDVTGRTLEGSAAGDTVYEAGRPSARRRTEAPSGAARTESNRDAASVTRLLDWHGRIVPRSGVPVAPFIGSTEDYLALSMKRMLRYAAEHDYQVLAWTTGEIQNERYDLSKQVDEINWSPAFGSIRVRPTGQAAYQFVTESGVTEQNLADYVGKDAAEKLLAAKEEGGWKTLEGQDLKVGGQGMKGFYDQILPRFMDRYGKAWGVHTHDVTIKTERAIDRPNITGVPVHGILITDKAREAALKGQPLFQGPRGSVEFPVDGTALIRALENPNVSTGLHEVAHVARRFLFDRSLPAEVREGVTDEDILTAEGWAGAKDGEWNTGAEEKFARGFERYLYDGEAPSSSLRSLFEKLSNWLAKVYRNLTSSPIDIEISPEMREVFDRLVTRSERLQETEAAGDTSFDVVALEAELDTLYQEDRPRTRQSAADELRAYEAEQGVSPPALTDTTDHRPASLAEIRRRLEEYRSGRAAALARIRTAADPSASRVAVSRIDHEIRDLLRQERGLIQSLRARPVADVLPTGEEQPRLPGAEAVREQEIATPQMGAPFSLTPETSRAKKGRQERLFQEGPPRRHTGKTLTETDLQSIATRRGISLTRARHVATEAGYEIVAGSPRSTVPVNVDEYFNFRRVNLSDEETDALKTAITDVVQRTRRNPKERVTFEEIRRDAQDLHPDAVAMLAPFQEGQAQFRAVRHAARQRVNALNRRAILLDKDLARAVEEERGSLRRQIQQLEDDRNALLDVWMRMRSDDGRALAMHRMEANSTWEDGVGFDHAFWMARVRRALGLPLGVDLPLDVSQRLNEILARGDAIAHTGQGDAVAVQRELADFLVKARKADWMEIVTAVRKAGLLTGLKTHLRNIGGSGAFELAEELSRVPAVVVDTILAAGTGRRTVQGVSPRAMVRATREAATTGVRQAAQILRHGAFQDDLQKMEVRRELNSGYRWLDAYVNTVFRTMGAEDRVFKSYAFRRSLEEQVKLHAVNTGEDASALLLKPTESMIAQAIADAEFATFNNPNVLAQGLQSGITTMRRGGTAGRAAAFAVENVVLFKNTPANIVARVLDYTPLGALPRASHAAVTATMNRSMTPAQQRAVSLALGRGLTGSALMTMGWFLAAAGLATGSDDDSAGDRNVARAARRLPGALLIDGRWRQIAPFSPVGNLITIGATMHVEATRPLRNEAARLGRLSGVAARVVLDQPMLTGLQDVIESLNRPGTRAEAAVSSMAGSFVPTIVADAAGLFDPYRRDARPEGASTMLTNGIMARLPFLRNLLPIREDVLGRPEAQTGMALWDPTIATVARELDDQVLTELLAHDVGVSWPQRQPQEPIEGYRRRARVVGRAIDATLRRVVASEAYQDATDAQQQDMLERAIRGVRDRIPARILPQRLEQIEEAQQPVPPVW